MAHPLASAVLAVATYTGKPPSDHTPWDTLFVTVGLVAMVLIVVLVASMLNARDDRGAR